MSWTDEELSEMARAAHAEQTFVYQDSFWSEASALLPQKKRRLLSLFLWALVPLASAVALWSLFQNQDQQVQYVAKTMDTRSNHGLRNIATSEQANSLAPKSENVTKQISALETNAHEITNMRRSTVATVSTITGQEPLKTTNSIATSDKAGSTIGASTEASSSQLATNTETGLVAKGTEVNNQSNDKEENSILEVNGFESRKELNIDYLTPLALTINPFNYEPAFPEFFTRKARNHWNMYAQAGFGMGQSYVYNQVGHTNTFSIGAGARYNFKGYFLQMGLAGELQKVKLEMSERAKIYHTSSTVVENLMSYKQLYRIEMPITLGYQLKNHVFQTNVSPAYLLGSKMDYKYLVDGSALRDETMFGNKTGWNDFTLSVGVGYGYQLFKTVTLGADLKWQLLNQLNKNMVNEGNVRPFSGQVFLRKTF